MTFYQEIISSVEHAERVINASLYFKEKYDWWKLYRHSLLKQLLEIQIKTFDRS